MLLLAGVIDGLFFAIEELLLFFVLIVVKHRMPPVLDRFTRSIPQRRARGVSVRGVKP